MQQSQRINFDELSALVALAETGSFVGAGRRLSHDPSVVSRRLQALEQHLGVRLAERTTRRVELTEAGRQYIERIRPLMLGLEEAAAEVSALSDGEPSGHLRISLPGNFAAVWLGPAIASFLAAHPQITMTADTTNRYVNIIDERYDAAIRLGTLSDSQLVARKVADRQRLLCASPAYIAARGAPAVPRDLLDHACLYSTGRANADRWTLRDGGDGEVEVRVTAALVSPSADLLVHAARAGVGILYTSDWYVGRDIADGTLVEVLPDYPVAEPGGVYIITPAARGMPSKTRAFSDWLAAELRKQPWRSA